MSTNNKKFVHNAILIGACVVVCVAIVAQAQYNTYDSDSNSDSDGNPILTQAELGKLVRNSGRLSGEQRLHHQQQAAASRNLYNRNQPLQYAPSYNKRINSDGMNNFGPMGSESAGRGRNQNNADDDGESSLGPNFGSNFDGGNDDENEGNNVNGDGQTMNLNQAASGYPGQGEYNNEAGLGFAGFGGSSGYGPSSDGSDFGPSDGFGLGEGRRVKSASSPRGYGSEEDAGAPLYGPNSAVNGDNEDEARAGVSPDGGNDNDNDDE